jgi:hypothetical protein
VQLSKHVQICKFSIHLLFQIFLHVVTNGKVTWLRKTWGFGLNTWFIGHLPLTTPMITIYSTPLSPIHTVTVYIALWLLHNYGLNSIITSTKSSGAGFQWRTFSFQGSWTVLATQPQRLLTHYTLSIFWSSLLLSRSVLSGALPITGFWTSVQYLLHWRSNNNSYWTFIY